MATPAAALPGTVPTRGSAHDPVAALIAVAGIVALAVIPWSLDGGSSALTLIVSGAKWPRYAASVALGPLFVAAIVMLVAGFLRSPRIAALAAGVGLVWGFAQGLIAAGNGPPFGIGAALTLSAFTVGFARALARLGWFSANATIATIVVVIATLLIVFIFYPVGSALVAAVLDARGKFAPGLVGERLLTADIWGFGCFGGGTRCGVAINSALLASIVGVLSTLLGLVLALVVQRGGKRYAGLLKVMSILPIITPPFVIALALVVLFGRTGLVTSWLDAAFGIGRSRWIYGLPGVALAQLLTFT